MRENSQEHFRSQEINLKSFKTGSPAPSHISGCRKTFRFVSKTGESGGEVSDPKRTSKGVLETGSVATRFRVKWVATLPVSFASGAIPIPPTCTRSYPDMSSPTTVEGDKRRLDVISRYVMRSKLAADDKRSALDASDTDDDDGCAEEGEGARTAGPKPES